MRCSESYSYFNITSKTTSLNKKTIGATLTYSHDHAVVFFNSTTATKKCNHEDNNSHNNEQNWTNEEFSMNEIRVIGVKILNNGTSDKNCNASYGKYKVKNK
ncbi:hypothetical protein L798_04294 [Zootermopsis nevadensis]|uniref:Uncharacterized protein n=1 Tax=Zootermopsis nevadensis TaxID=136037 RepID=A0A067QSN8_ZOONE|nr:hypothetical protein L798_04294 [Zootermopsis nevadensis]